MDDVRQAVAARAGLVERAQGPDDVADIGHLQAGLFQSDPGEAGRLLLFGLVVGVIAAAGELPRVVEEGDERGQVLVLFFRLGQAVGLGGDEDRVLPEKARLAVLFARVLLLAVLDRPADALDESGREGGQRAVEFLLFEKHGGLGARSLSDPQIRMSSGGSPPGPEVKNGDVSIFEINAFFLKIETSPFSSLPGFGGEAVEVEAAGRFAGQDERERQEQGRAQSPFLHDVVGARGDLHPDEHQPRGEERDPGPMAAPRRIVDGTQGRPGSDAAEAVPRSGERGQDDLDEDEAQGGTSRSGSRAPGPTTPRTMTSVVMAPVTRVVRANETGV